ncbi:SPW repeat protein [Streptomyces sp. NPDC005931]|uniref:SPW repeat protein n=1 Tax=Streptomyces sp. NPDC005931 TaxID=3364737 RepID=UPI0036B37DD3
METHPDILEMRARHERAATTPRAQAIEALGVVTGVYLAASPWIVGFSGFSTLAVTNLIVGLTYALLMGGFGHAYERTHSMAWAAAVLGAWTVIAPWVVSGDVDTTRTVTNNIIVGLIALLLALAAASSAGMRSDREMRGASSGYGGRTTS